MESDKNEENQAEESSVEDSNAQVDSSEEDHTPLSKVAGKTEYLNKLDNIQKELDAMPDKKDSDKGVTNAMKNYYGVSYERYDDALNEIYSLLKKELSPEVMKELKAEQVKWIEQKEAKAEKERLKYEGGTFENVAWYISLYESTKDRCYELVNEYMTD
ncbi:lysozyme inhibitor LprI family protein [Rossellomorea aquimaris]|uniref:lysozyme inhibitor LprI family protein n=1 Tax=Rossellomorea aquimaris TaxID=189382 RepID=UPI00215DB89C|nr:lysozyme inhibitor LprI family protein [Rossellomorea aquimaris]